MIVSVAKEIPVGDVFVDTIEPITLAIAKLLASRGCKGVGRYLESLTEAECQIIWGQGMFVVPFCYADKFDGVWAAGRAAAVGLPHTVHIVADLEEDHDSATTVSTYLNSFTSGVRAGSFDAAEYVGADQPLTASQNGALALDRYGKSASNVETPMGSHGPIGFAWMQLFPGNQTITDGTTSVEIDWNVSQRDYLGRGLIAAYPPAFPMSESPTLRELPRVED